MKAEKKRIKRRGRLNKTKKMPKTPRPQKQLTLDSIPNASQKEPAKPNLQSLEKRIVITEIGVSTKEDELALKVSFKLFPSKTAFSKVQSMEFRACLQEGLLDSSGRQRFSGIHGCAGW